MQKGLLKAFLMEHMGIVWDTKRSFKGLFDGKKGNCMRRQLGTVTKEKEPFKKAFEKGHGKMVRVVSRNNNEGEGAPCWIPVHWLHKKSPEKRNAQIPYTYYTIRRGRLEHDRSLKEDTEKGPLLSGGSTKDPFWNPEESSFRGKQQGNDFFVWVLVEFPEGKKKRPSWVSFFGRLGTCIPWEPSNLMA